MAMDQDGIDTGPTGRVINADDVRSMRNKEQWERHDTIMIGAGATSLSRGWFDTWAAFARTPQISWFQSRDANVDLAYTNQKSERYDYAQDLYQCHFEFLTPTFNAQFDSLGATSQATVQLIQQELPKSLGVEVLLADSDIIAQAPGTAFMSGRGNSGGYAQDTGASVVHPGNNGNADKANGWTFPDPIMIAKQAKLTVRATIANPLKDLLAALPGPGSYLVPNAAGGLIESPMWFGLRVTFRGPRYMQLRGARSQA